MPPIAVSRRELYCRGSTIEVSSLATVFPSTERRLEGHFMARGLFLAGRWHFLFGAWLGHGTRCGVFPTPPRESNAGKVQPPIRRRRFLGSACRTRDNGSGRCLAEMF